MDTPTEQHNGCEIYQHGQLPVQACSIEYQNDDVVLMTISLGTEEVDDTLDGSPSIICGNDKDGDRVETIAINANNDPEPTLISLKKFTDYKIFSLDTQKDQIHLAMLKKDPELDR